MGWGSEMRFRDCPWCGLREAEMRVLATNAAATASDNSKRYWSLVACPRCAGVIVVETSADGRPPEILRTMPEDEAVAHQVDHLPDDVARFYRDSQRVMDSGVPDAAAVQLRKTLEAAAAHFEVQEGSLVTRIEKLIERGLVTKQFGKVLNHIRKIGNVGAHASDETVDEQSARRALRFTTQVLRNLFEIPGQLGDIEKESESEPDEE